MTSLIFNIASFAIVIIVGAVVLTREAKKNRQELEKLFKK